MANLVKRNYSKRVIFSPGEQQQFLLKARQNLNLSWASFAEKIWVHKRTLNDWKREEYSIPLNIVKKISRIAKVKIPENIKIKEPFWYIYKGAKVGGKMGAIACIRGLVDTDGCVFTHRYKVNGKLYSYKKLSFTSYSEPLRQSVFNLLKDNRLNPRFAQRRDVRLDNIKDIQKYFRIIDSHNPKHLKRYKN